LVEVGRLVDPGALVVEPAEGDFVFGTDRGVQVESKGDKVGEREFLDSGDLELIASFPLAEHLEETGLGGQRPKGLDVID
jgi:hypothetical protein